MMFPNRNLLCWLACLLTAQILGSAPIASQEVHSLEHPTRLPREVTVATVSSEGIRSNDVSERVNSVIQRMREVVSKQPDLICLPELFAQIQITDSALSVKKSAMESQQMIIEPIASFAAEHRCIIVCPLYRMDNDRVYNSALVINREGHVAGHYDKVHTTLSEMDLGVSPGALEQNVIITDIGKIGIQICYDIEWKDGWEALKRQGAEIVVWPSAFGGGRMLTNKAPEVRCNVISSTGAGQSRICDCAGEVVASTNRWHTTAYATINLERAFLHTWPSVQKFAAIEAKYGELIKIRTFPEEEWSIIESLSSDVRVADVLREFELETRDSQLQRAEARQSELR